MEKEKKEVTLEDLQKQIADITSQVSSLQEENTKLKEQVTQKDLQITKLTLGGVEKKKDVNEVEEDVTFDFDF